MSSNVAILTPIVLSNPHREQAPKQTRIQDDVSARNSRVVLDAHETQATSKACAASVESLFTVKAGQFGIGLPRTVIANNSELAIARMSQRRGTGDVGAEGAWLGVNAVRWLAACFVISFSLACLTPVHAHFEPWNNRTGPSHAYFLKQLRVEVEYRGDAVVDPRYVHVHRLPPAGANNRLGHWSTHARVQEQCAKTNQEQTGCLSQFFMAEQAPLNRFHQAYTANIIKGGLLADAWRYLPRPKADTVHFSLQNASMSVTRMWIDMDSNTQVNRDIFLCPSEHDEACQWSFRDDSLRVQLTRAAVFASKYSGQHPRLHIEHCDANRQPSLWLTYSVSLLHQGALMRAVSHQTDAGPHLRDKNCRTVIPLRMMQEAMRLDRAEGEVPLPMQFAIPPRPRHLRRDGQSASA